MASETLLIIDIGTSSVRVSLVDEALCIQHAATVKRPVAAQFDIGAEWKTIQGMVREITGLGLPIAGVAVSALLGWVATDAQGTALTPCYTYMDQQPEALSRLADKMDSKGFYAITGRRMSAEMGGLKLAALQAQNPALYRRTASFYSLKDYINHQLTGSAATDLSHACYTGLWDLGGRRFHAELLAALGLDAAKLPPVREPSVAMGHVSAAAATQLGLPAGIPVAASGPDGSAGILGAGGTQPGRAVSVMGTTDVFFAVSGTPVYDETMGCCLNHHLVPGLWLVGGPMGMSGGTLDWFTRDILSGVRTLQEMDALAAGVSPGSEGVLFVPSLTGERTPFWEASMRGTICGMTPAHGAEHLYRAIMEANGYTIRRITELCAAGGLALEELLAIGGGARSSLWLQIKADITGIPTRGSQMLEATTRGAAMLACLAGGRKLEELPQLAYTGVHMPGSDTAGLYKKAYADYLRLLQNLGQFYRPE